MWPLFSRKELIGRVYFVQYFRSFSRSQCLFLFTSFVIRQRYFVTTSLFSSLSLLFWQCLLGCIYIWEDWIKMELNDYKFVGRKFLAFRANVLMCMRSSWMQIAITRTDVYVWVWVCVCLYDQNEEQRENQHKRVESIVYGISLYAGEKNNVSKR